MGDIEAATGNGHRGPHGCPGVTVKKADMIAIVQPDGQVMHILVACNPAPCSCPSYEGPLAVLRRSCAQQGRHLMWI